MVCLLVKIKYIICAKFHTQHFCFNVMCGDNKNLFLLILMENFTQLKSPHIVCVLWEFDSFLRDSAILKSQALGQMRYLLSLGARITIICSDPDPVDFMESFGARIKNDGFEVIVVGTKGYANLLSLMDFRKQLAALDRKFSIDCIYIRNFWNILAIPSKKIKVLFDLRGANQEETAFNAKDRWGLKLALKNKIYSYFEREAIKRANFLQCVSFPLKKYIGEHFGRKDAEVVSSCFEVGRFALSRQTREKMREMLCITQDEIAFMFLGGMASYQEIDFMLLLWGEIAAAVPESKFIFFTSDKNHGIVKDKLLAVGVFGERFIIRSVGYDDVPKFCAAGDFGFLLRQDIVLNHVASPVKFSEYLAAGLGVITSPKVGDISGCVEDSRVGCLVEVGDMNSSVNAIKSLVDQFRKDRMAFSAHAQKIAHEKFSWDAYRDYYIKRYF